MSIARIAARVAGFGSEPGFPDILPLVYKFFGHASWEDVESSPLDDEDKAAVGDVLSKKARLQDLYGAWEASRRSFRDEDKAFHRLAMGRAPVVEALSNLMKAARPKIEQSGEKWSPKYDAAFDYIVKWEFPADPDKGWWVDVWVQGVHDLTTAIFSQLLHLSKPKL
jgi:hypothetical protein